MLKMLGRCSVLALAVWLVLGGGAWAQFPPGNDGEKPIGEPKTFPLTFRENGFSLPWEVTNKEVEFKQLPATKDAAPMTAFFSFVNLGVLWDREGRKLYADVNRNGDLTDDPVYDAKAGEGETQIFSGIRLEHEGFPFTVGFTGDQKNSYPLRMSLQNAWQGDIELAGVKRTVAVLGRPRPGDSSLNLCYIGLPHDPAGKTDLPVNAQSFLVYNANRLFIDNHDYKTNLRFDKDARPPVVLLSMQEMECKTKAWNVSGRNILRLKLNRQFGGTAVFDRTVGEISIPADASNFCEVYLWRPEDPNLCLTTNMLVQDDHINVGEALTQRLEINRYGTSINTRLIWRDNSGNSYGASAVTPDSTPPRPKFEIRQGEKTLVSMNLEYG